MRAVLLAAGYGTRLGKLTKSVPKPLIEVGGRPIIDHIISRLNKAGIYEIIVNLHYLKDQITGHLGDRVLYYYEPKLLGHEGTIRALKNWLNDDFFVINCDTLSNVNYTKMIQSHQKDMITAYMDEWRCIGTWIYSPTYFEKDIPVIPYREPNTVWFDIGNPERLEEARKYFDG